MFLLGDTLDRQCHIDTSAWSLLGANLAAIVIALWENWSLAELMLIYWVQSIVIGGSYVARIFALYITMIIGATFGAGFGILKTIVDTLMHFVEHKHLQTKRQKSQPQP